MEIAAFFRRKSFNQNFHKKKIFMRFQFLEDLKKIFGSWDL